jgi:hypothetical protein
VCEERETHSRVEKTAWAGWVFVLFSPVFEEGHEQTQNPEKKKINKKKQSKEKKNLPRVATNFPFFFFFFFFFFFYCLRLRGGTPLTRAISRYNTTCSRFGLLGLPLTTLDIYTGENLERQKIKIKRSGRTCDQLFTHFVRSAVKERKGI